MFLFYFMILPNKPNLDRIGSINLWPTLMGNNWGRQSTIVKEMLYTYPPKETLPETH